MALGIFNLLNAQNSDIDYYYPSRLPGEPLGGVNDIHFHPTLPSSARFNRLVNVADDQVTFRWKDYAHGSASRLMTVGATEFLRRFFLHVLPRGFVRIRFFGFLAHRRRAHDLALCQRALESQPARATPTAEQAAPSRSWACPRCGGAMIVIERLTPHQIGARAILEGIFVDTS